MEKENFENLRKKIEKLQIIIRKYKTYSLRLMRKNDFSDEEIRKYKEYKDRFDLCLACLGDFEAMCISNTFMHNKFYWWENYYSDAQYYRYRAKAVNNFVDSFTEEN